MHRRGGFTLIELLVVIAIIAILAAILFPVFTRVRKAAWTRACTSNLRQIYTAMRMYENDNGNVPPIRNWWYGWETRWLDRWSMNVVLAPYASDKKVFRCESYRRTFRDDEDPVRYELKKDLGYFITINWQNGGYYNGMCPDPWFIDVCWGKGKGYSPPKRFDHLVRPDKYTMMICLTTNDHIGYVDTSGGKSVIMGTTACKADGHVEFIIFADDVASPNGWQQYMIEYWFGGIPNGTAFPEGMY